MGKYVRGLRARPGWSDERESSLQRIRPNKLKKFLGILKVMPRLIMEV